LRYIKEIDGLRALAVIAVIINHLNSVWLPGGFLGVDIFFVISGFVVTGSLLNSKDVKFTDFIINFYRKRIKRLYPALLFCVLISTILTLMFVVEPHESIKTGIMSLFGISNFYLIKIGTNYFALDASLNVFTHTWSLAVEEQFYFIFPVLVFLTGISISFDKSIKSFTVLASGLWVISIVFYLYSSHEKPDWAFYLMPARFWQLISGGLIYTSIRCAYFKKLHAEWVSVPLVGIIFCLLLPEEYKTYTTIGITFLTALILLFIKENKKPSVILGHDYSVNVGKISYSLYLWHWPVIVLLRYTLGVNGFLIFLPLALTILLTMFSYFKVEKHLRHVSWGRRGAFAFLAIMCSVPLVQPLIKKYARKIYLGNQKEEYSLLTNKDQWNLDCGYFANKKFFSEVITDVDCSVNGGLSNHQRSKKIYAFGNSYLSQHVPAIDVLARSNTEFTFFAYAASGCPLWQGTYLPFDKMCSQIYKNFLETVARIGKKGDRILLATPFSFYYKANLFLREDGSSLSTAEEVLKIFQEDIRKVTDSFRARGIEVFLVSPIPMITIKKPEVCYQPWSFLRNDCVGFLDSELNKVIELHHRKLEKLAGINYINIYDPILKIVANDSKLIRMYHDHVHVSAYSKYFIADIFKESFKLKYPPHFVGFKSH
jgi:peptidoglycan/LPS O-acetylase OafA/YrhL